MIYLDTHVLVYLSAPKMEEISFSGLDAIENDDKLLISPIVELELQYLYEIKRVNRKPNQILDYLAKQVGLEICKKSFDSIIASALKIHWTRDPFDRIITATAAIDDNVLVTGDRNIRKHYKHAIW